MKETLKLALDALENHSGNYKLSEVECVKHEAVVEAIKEALAQPEQEPVADPFADIHNKRIGEMTEEQQDRAIELWLRNQRGWMPMGQRVHVEALLRVIDGLRATPPQPKEPEQEPVAWMSDEIEDCDGDAVHDFSSYQDSHCKNPLYTTPPQRTWVGLTPEERDNFWKADQMTSKEWEELFDAIEAKLKEKNT